MFSPAVVSTIICLTQLAILKLPHVATALKCAQCDGYRRTGRLELGGQSNSMERVAQYMADCIAGQAEPIECSSPTHTHCVTNFYKSSAISGITVLWRKCGVAKEEQAACTRYRFAMKKHKRRHRSQWKRKIELEHDEDKEEVRVCEIACSYDACGLEMTQAVQNRAAIAKQLHTYTTALLICFSLLLLQPLHFISSLS